MKYPIYFSTLVGFGPFGFYIETHAHEPSQILLHPIFVARPFFIFNSMFQNIIPMVSLDLYCLELFYGLLTIVHMCQSIVSHYNSFLEKIA